MAYCVAIKCYGWHDPIGIRQYNTKTQISGTHKLIPCSREACTNTETQPNQYPRCAFCLTTYCCRECQRLDWSNHKSFCKSIEAYKSHLNKWQTSLQDQGHQLLDLMSTGEYNKLWNAWMDSPKMLQILKHINLTKLNIKPT